MLLSALFAATVGIAADSTLLRILSINDFHGRLDAQVYPWSNGRPVGGAAALKSLMDSAEARCRCPTLRLDGGDQMQGTLISNLSYGRSTVAALTRMGIRAAAVGNHDLDWSADTLRARMREAGYAWLAANVFDSATGRRADWAKPWQLVDLGGWRIAIVGLLTAETRNIVRAEYIAGLEFRRGKAAIADALTEAKAQRPDLTIIVAHAGAICDSTACRGEIIELARQLDSTEVQLIVSGHTHSLVNTVVNGIPIIQARSYSTALAHADLVRLPDGSRVWRTGVETVWADQVTPDPGMARILEPFRGRADSLALRRVATLRDSLPQPQGEGPLGNLMADAWRRIARADFGLMNNGGIRTNLPAGSVSYARLFELAPFQNKVVRIELSGAVLKQAIESRLGARPGVHVSGLVVRWDPRRPAGSRIVRMTLSNGRPVRDSTRYTLGTLDFLATGGDGMTMLVKQPRHDTGLVDVDALADYLARLPQPVVAPRTRRFIAVTP